MAVSGSSDDLGAALDDAWARLAPGRYVVLATTARNGAEARMLVLRGADREAERLMLHTDAATAKVAELAAHPRATLLAWDPDDKVQIRVRVTVEPRPGTTAEWAALGETARRLYGGFPEPGAPIDNPEDHELVPDPARFRVLMARVEEIETLRLGHPHARAVFRRDEGFRGTWVAP